MQPFVLSAPRLRLDQPEARDVDAIAEYCADPVFENLMTLPWPYTREDAAHFVAKHVPRGWQSGTELTWAIREGGGGPLLGVIGLRVGNADLGFWMGGPHRGKGFMPKAVQLVTRWVFDSGYAGLDAINWECVVGNTSSASVARKSGFAYTGVRQASVSARDGSHPDAWHAVLRTGDSAEPKPGWPPEVADSPARSIFVVVPTYCERQNLPTLIDRIRAAEPGANVLIVDDNSPDGTGRLADELARDHDLISVLHRPGKAGLGQAYVAGFRHALASGADYIIEMDADGSHRPEQLPLIVSALEQGAALAIGTRWMPGGAVLNWPLHRRLISRAGTGFARLMLGSKLRDITSGFRGFPRRTLEPIDLDTISSAGYCFQVELAWKIENAGLTVVEVPITFIERTLGRSKMTFAIVAEALWKVTVWGVQARLAGIFSTRRS